MEMWDENDGLSGRFRAWSVKSSPWPKRHTTLILRSSANRHFFRLRRGAVRASCAPSTQKPSFAQYSSPQYPQVGLPGDKSLTPASWAALDAWAAATGDRRKYLGILKSRTAVEHAAGRMRRAFSYQHYLMPLITIGLSGIAWVPDLPVVKQPRAAIVEFGGGRPRSPPSTHR